MLYLNFKCYGDLFWFMEGKKKIYKKFNITIINNKLKI